MKNSRVVLLMIVCISLYAEDAYSLPWWKHIRPLPPPNMSAGSPLPAPGEPGFKPQLPNWFRPPTADEIARCKSARDDKAKWKPCLDEGLEQRRKGIFTPGPVCCSIYAGIIDACYSKFPPQIQDLIYPPSTREHCSQYLSPNRVPIL